MDYFRVFAQCMMELSNSMGENRAASGGSALMDKKRNGRESGSER